jgi:hypothetical protein
MLKDEIIEEIRPSKTSLKGRSLEELKKDLRRFDKIEDIVMKKLKQEEIILDFEKV